jgi:hypothetical protein
LNLIISNFPPEVAMRILVPAALVAALLVSACQKPPPKPPKPIAALEVGGGQLLAQSSQ